MNVEARWHDDRKTAIEISVHDYEPAWAAFDAVVDQALELAKSVSHRVVIILNLQDVTMLTEEKPFRHLRPLITRTPVNVPFIIIVLTDSGFYDQAVIDVLARLSLRVKVKTVYTLEEAYAQIPL